MKKLSVFVTVGTNHYNFDRMLQHVESCLNLIEQDYEAVIQYGYSSPYSNEFTVQSEHMLSRDDAEAAYANADLVFSHCGIGSIYNSLYYNRPTVILPRLKKYSEFSDDHQLQIAREIAANPLVFLLEEKLDNAKFRAFLASNVPQVKTTVDLTNYELSHFIQERLYQNNEQNDSLLTIVNAGGHLTQSLCIMKAIANYHLVTSIDLKSKLGAKTVTVINGTQFNPFTHFYNIFIAFKIIKKIQPIALFSTGGPICIPFAVVAKLMKKRFIYLDTLSRVQDLSNTAKFLYKYQLANEIYTQWPSVAEQYDGITCQGKTFNICGESIK